MAANRAGNRLLSVRVIMVPPCACAGNRVTGESPGKSESSDLRALVFHQDAKIRPIGGVIVPVVVPHYSQASSESSSS